MSNDFYNEAPEIDAGNVIEVVADKPENEFYTPVSNSVENTTDDFDYTYVRHKYKNIDRVVVLGVDKDNNVLTKFHIKKDATSTLAKSFYNRALRLFECMERKKKKEKRG